MSRLFSLDERLRKCASLVRNGARLVDVGSDHAYLPVRLSLQNKISFAIASDIGEKPLQRGMQIARKYGAENVEFRLGAGLSTVTPEDRITDIVIAGMGGEVISDIIAQSALCRDSQLNLILQPMTRVEQLIGFLYGSGFEIISQSGLMSKGRPYTVIQARYSGKSANVSEAFKIVGKLDISDGDSREYVKKQMRNLENKARADSSAKALLNELRLMINE